MTQDLANRLEKAIADCDKFGTAYGQAISRTQLIALMVDNAPTIFASLRRSVPASGEMGEAWVAAIDVPKEWEGKLAWRWRDWDQSLGVQQDTIPYNFDRSPGSCRGVYFMLLSRPSSPSPAARRARRQDREQR